MGLNSAVAQQSSNPQLIEIRKLKSDFGSFSDYLAFREELMSKTIHPWLKGAYQGIYDAKIPEGISALIAYESVDGTMIISALLSFEELDLGLIERRHHPFDGITGFNEWVANFDPGSWGDWLMVPKLFLMHLRTGHDLPALAATPDPFIDAVLRESRGVLMWSHQFIEIIRMIAGVGMTNAAKIHSNYFVKRQGWEKSLEIIYPSTNQTLLQIFEERSLGMQSLGSPDYIQADWLSRHFDNTRNMVA